MTKNPHIHKMKRLKYKSGNTIFFCALPDCSYKTNPSLALGKRSLCWRCGEPFIMSEYSLRLAKPHCPNCHQPKSLQEKVVETTLLDNLSLAERLSQTIQQAQEKEEDEL